MLSPTDPLKNALFDLRLCTPQQLAACEPEVRRLIGDLPGFDSCWLDVLVAHRVVTPWQSQCLQSEQPDAMRQGNYRLREPLGDRTWLAETFDRRRLVVLHELQSIDLAQQDSLHERAAVLIEKSGLLHDRISPAICLPRELLSEHRDAAWFVSPFVSGWRLDELLIRGGRLPWEAVSEIGAVLLSGLEQLDTNELTHGDISLRNIRLRPDGLPVLVDPFRTRLLQPAIGYRTDMRLRDVEFCAPELVGTGRRHDVVSDLYSLGSVLWRLLTARPTFLSADPVRYLMQCREHDVEDVRRWVPDCPDALAHAILSMTRRRPELRPQTPGDVRQSWPLHSRRSHTATRRLLQRMPDRSRISLPVPPSIHRRKIVRGSWVAAGLASCVMVGLAGNFVPLPLTMNRTSVSSDETIATAAALPVEVTSGPRALHEPSADGDLQLTAGQTYMASQLQFAGHLHVFAEGEKGAIILVADGESWQIIAEQIQLTNLHIRCDSDNGSPDRLIDAQSRVLTIDQSVVELPVGSAGTGVFWESQNVGSSILQLQDSVFLSGRQAIRTSEAPDRFDCDNVLFRDAQTGWRCDVSGASRVTVNADHVTLLNAQSLIDVIPTDTRGPADVAVTCGDSVLNPSAAIVRMASPNTGWSPDATNVAFYLAGRSRPTIIPPKCQSAVWLDRSLGHLVAFPDSQVLSESLLMAESYFDSSGTSDHPFRNAQLIDFEGPKLDARMPGIAVERLPEFPSCREE